MDFDNNEEFEKFLLEDYDELNHKKNIMERVQDNPLKNINVCNINYINADIQQSDEARSVITTYIKHGPELNARLRGAPANKDLGIIRANIIKASRPITSNCQSDSYYIVYRAITNIYDKSINQGFMSSSNILIPQFGNFFMKIYIPIQTPVLVRNISKEIKRNGVYEIVLPENTILEPLGYDSLSNYNIYILGSQNGGKGTRQPHFYTNPLTERVISSDGLVYKQLKRRRFKLKADTCLYNITSAKNCLTQILNKYGDKIHPSNKFINIPSTYHSIKTKSPKARAFIKTNDKKYIKGFIDKSGDVFKLPNIPSSKINIPEVTSIPEHQTLLDKKIETGVIPKETDIIDIQEQLYQEPLHDKITILYNPTQDDFIPIKDNFDEIQQAELLLNINNTLIPSNLPPLNNTHIAAIILDKSKLPIQITGFTDTTNNTVKFNTPININTLNQNDSKLDSHDKDEITLSNEKIDSIPHVEIEKNNMFDLEEATQETKAKFLNKITKICGVNEQLHPTNNKCYSCEYYNLIWDSGFKKCKLKDKLLTIIEDTQGNILGYA